MKIGDEVYVHGYIDEIRNDVIIIRNEGGYFGTVPSEVVDKEETLQNLTKPYKSDLISRQAAIDALYDKGLSMTAWGELLAMKWSDIQTCIELLPSAQPFTSEQIQTMQELESAQLEKAYELGKADRPKWIPCSERLPEEGDVVLICSKIGVIDFGKRKGDKWVWLAEALCDYWQETEDLIAWMPLPEAYKESDADGSD